MEEYENPGAQTPWGELNRLLKPEERFEIKKNSQTFFRFAPRDVSTLSAVFFLCKEKNISICTDFEWNFQVQACISTKNLNRVVTIDPQESLLVVEAGCELQELNGILFQEKYELGLSDWVWSTKKKTVGQALISQSNSGEILQGYPLSQRLIGLEIMQDDGTLARIGGKTLSSCKGPIFPAYSLQGIITSAFFQIIPIPKKRIKLTWSSLNRQHIDELALELAQKITSWERLDIIASSNPEEKCFLLAQICGTEEEMATFKKICPQYASAVEEDLLPKFKSFFTQKGYSFSQIKGQEKLNESTYQWMHTLTLQGWQITPGLTEMTH